MHNTSNGNNLNGIVNDVREEFENEIGLMVVVEDNNDLYEIDEEGALVATGKVFNVERDRRSGAINVNSNPMPVLEIVSGGKWVVVDANEDIDNDTISRLVEFVSNSAGACAFGALGGELSSSGGIALSCSTQARVVEMGALIKALSGNKGYKATASGVLVQSSDESSSSSSSNDGSSSSIAYAIVMPFDALLWKTSSFVFGAIEAYEEAEG